MLIGVPKELKNHEYRVGLTPGSVRELIAHGHKVVMETQAGTTIGFSDDMYRKVGADIASSAAEVFGTAEMIVKVKEPQPQEYQLLRPGQILFTYLHLAPDPEQTKGIIDSGAIAIAYETVTDDFGGLPLLAPMSEVAGRMSIQAGAQHLQKSHGGMGILLGGVTGVQPGRVVIIGGGVVGTNAARMAIGLGAKVTVVDKNVRRLKEIDETYHSSIQTAFPTITVMEELIAKADLVIGAVLVAGGQAPKILTKQMLSLMKPGAVVLDVAIDQGGCFETSRPTSHAEPTYVVDGIIHYCVTNMPGAVPKTSTKALNNVTLPHIMNIAGYGVDEALRRDRHLCNGLNVYRGEVTHESVANDLGYRYHSSGKLLNVG